MLAQLLTLFGFFSLILVALYWVNRAVNIFDRLIADGQTAWAVLALTSLSLPSVIAIVLPMSTFGAAVYVANRLMSDSELIVVQATGFSPTRLILPALYFGVLVALFSAVLHNYLGPIAAQESAKQQRQIAEDTTASLLNPGVFLHPTSGVTFFVGEIDEQGKLKSLFLNDARSGTHSITYTAREAFLISQDQIPKLVMLNGSIQNLELETRRMSVTKFADFSFDISRLISAARPVQPSVRQLPTVELLSGKHETADLMGTTPKVLKLEGHKRLSEPVLTTIAGLIGFATLLLGSFSRFGLWRQIFIASGMLIALKFTENFFEVLARETDAGWAMVYGTPIVGIIMVAVILFLASRKRRPVASGPNSGVTA